MATKEELNQQYTQLCAQLGHMQFRKMEVEAAANAAHRELKDLSKRTHEMKTQRDALSKTMSYVEQATAASQTGLESTEPTAPRSDSPGISTSV